MKAIIQEGKDFKIKKLLTTVIGTEGWNAFTGVTLVYEEEIGYCMRPSVFSGSRLTSAELRGIAKKIDEYNTQLKNKDGKNS